MKAALSLKNNSKLTQILPDSGQHSPEFRTGSVLLAGKRELPALVLAGLLAITAAPASYATNGIGQSPGHVHKPQPSPCIDLVVHSPDRISLAVIDAELYEVLDMLSGHFNLELYLGGTLNQRVTIKLLNKPIHAVLAELLKEKNYLLKYGPVAPNRSKQGKPLNLHTQTGTTDSLHLDMHSGRNTTTMYNPAKRTKRDRKLKLIGVIENLGDYENEKSMKLLARALASSDVDIRMEAIASLSDLGGPANVELLGRAAHDTNPEVRQEALYALSDIGSPLSLTYMIQALNDPNPDVREFVISELALVKTEDSINALMNALNDTVTNNRVSAVYALAEIGIPAAEEKLWELSMYRDPGISSSAYEMLNKIAKKR